MKRAPLFGYEEALRYGWDMLQRHWRELVPLGVVSLLLQWIAMAVGRAPGAAAALLGLPVQLAQLAVTIAWLRVCLRIHDGQPVTLGEAIDAVPPRFVSFLLASILYGLVVAVGLVLLIVPGFVWGVRYGAFGFAIVDEGHDPLAAFRRSAALTDGRKGHLFGFAVVLCLVNLLGAMALGVGLLATLPITALAATYAYRRLVAAAAAPAPPPPSTVVPTPA
jgi:uncharacterized membrane protein